MAINLPDMLRDIKPWDESEEASVRQVKQFLEMSDNPYDRSNLVGHTVCDAWVISPDRQQVLLLVHGADKIWTAPGGHADGSPDMLGAARRELFEETGVSFEQALPLLDGAIFDVSTNIVPERMKKYGLEPAHVHFNICFAFQADPTFVTLQISDESLQLQWHYIREAKDILMSSHQRRALKTIQGLFKSG